MVMYFGEAIKRRPKETADVAELRKIGMRNERVYEVEQDHRGLLYVSGKRAAQELGVREVAYSGDSVSITFNVEPDYRRIIPHDMERKMAVFSPTRLTILARTLRGPDYRIEMSQYDRLAELAMAPESLSIDIAVGQEEKLVLCPDSTYRALEAQGFAHKTGKRYEPSPGFTLVETGKTKGFLGIGRQRVVHAERRETKPVYTTLCVSADGSVSVDATQIGNKNVQTALGVVVRYLFGLDDLKPTPESDAGKG